MELLIGAVVAVIVQVVKKLAGTHEWATLAVLAGVSIAAAAVMFGLQRWGLWEAFLEIMVAAAGIYAIIIARFENRG